MTNTDNAYTPDTVSNPLDTLLEMAPEGSQHLEAVERALLMHDWRRLLNGYIDRELAERIANVIGPSAEFWIARGEQYRKSIEGGVE